MIQETDCMIATEWQCVDLGQQSDYVLLKGFHSFDGQNQESTKHQEIFKWIDEYEGLGKYYRSQIFDIVYFERDEDREMFILRRLP